MSQTQVKTEPEEPSSQPCESTVESDAGAFSHVQTQIERCKDELKELRKQLRPLKKRLLKHMEEEQFTLMTCGEFILSRQEPSEDQEDPKYIFNEQTVVNFFDERAVVEYYADPNHRRPARKRPRVTVERQIVEVDDE